MAASASAAAESVRTLKERTALQMRAYLTVVVGSATYQERDKHLRFEGKPLLVNAGNTPARNVRHAARAALLPVPLPADHVFPPVVTPPAGAMLGPHQNSTLSAVVDDYVPDQDVDAIKSGLGRALYVWGRVVYEDIFGEEHTTDFCQTLTFLADNRVYGFYIAGRNNAT